MLFRLRTKPVTSICSSIFVDHAFVPMFSLIIDSIFAGEHLKTSRNDEVGEEIKNEEGERDCESDKEDPKRKRKRSEDGHGGKDDTQGEEKLSTPSESSTTSQGTNGSTSPDMKRRRLAESPLTSNAEVSSWRPCFISSKRLLATYFSFLFRSPEEGRNKMAAS